MLHATRKRRATHHLPTNQEDETKQDTGHNLKRHTEIQKIREVDNVVIDDKTQIIIFVSLRRVILQ